MSFHLGNTPLLLLLPLLLTPVACTINGAGLLATPGAGTEQRRSLRWPKTNLLTSRLTVTDRHVAEGHGGDAGAFLM